MPSIGHAHLSPNFRAKTLPTGAGTGRSGDSCDLSMGNRSAQTTSIERHRDTHKSSRIRLDLISQGFRSKTIRNQIESDLGTLRSITEPSKKIDRARNRRARWDQKPVEKGEVQTPTYLDKLGGWSAETLTSEVSDCRLRPGSGKSRTPL